MNKNVIVSPEVLYKVLQDGIWYFNKNGKVCKVYYPVLTIDAIENKSSKQSVRFSWECLNKTFWLTKEEAEIEAKKFIAKVEAVMSFSLYKKIANLKCGEIIYTIEEHFGKVFINKHKVLGYHYVDKSTLSFWNNEKFNDDDEEEFMTFFTEHKLSEYGINWSLNREDLEKRLKG